MADSSAIGTQVQPQEVKGKYQYTTKSGVVVTTSDDSGSIYYNSKTGDITGYNLQEAEIQGSKNDDNITLFDSQVSEFESGGGCDSLSIKKSEKTDSATKTDSTNTKKTETTKETSIGTPKSETVTVQKWGSKAQNGEKYANDCLYRIADNQYPELATDSNKSQIYKAIQELNPQIKDVNLIYTGDKLKMPEFEVDADGNITGWHEYDADKAKETEKNDTENTTDTDNTAETDNNKTETENTLEAIFNTIINGNDGEVNVKNNYYAAEEAADTETETEAGSGTETKKTTSSDMNAKLLQMLQTIFNLIINSNNGTINVENDYNS